MPLYSGSVHVNSPQQGVQGHVADILIIVQQEPAQDVDGQHPQTALRLDVHDGQDGLVEDGVANVLASLRVGGHLCQDVVHGLRRLCVILAQDPEEAENLHLKDNINELISYMNLHTITN